MEVEPPVAVVDEPPVAKLPPLPGLEPPVAVVVVENPPVAELPPVPVVEDPPDEGFPPVVVEIVDPPVAVMVLPPVAVVVLPPFGELPPVLGEPPGGVLPV